MTTRAIAATVWLGPVSLVQVPGASVPGAPVLSVACTGDGQPPCAAIAESWTDASGRKLPTLLAQKGLQSDAAIAAAAFSAGGSLLKRLCLAPADRAQLRVVHSADASYETAKGPDGPAPVEGYTRFCLEALTDPTKLFVSTASAGANKSFGSGIQVLASTRLELQRRAGVLLPQVPFLPGAQDVPGAVYHLGGVWMAEFPGVPHAQHATVLAPKIWQALILPWLASAPPATPQPPPPGSTPAPPAAPASSTGCALAFAGGVVLGYGAVRLLDRWW